MPLATVVGMGQVLESIDDRLAAWLTAQPVFFVATAPLAGDGLVNCSPKGLSGSLAVLDDMTVAYLDFAGSNAETIAHLRENGRIVIMFCAFEGRPNIVRLHGTGRAVLPHEEDFADLVGSEDFFAMDFAEAEGSVGADLRFEFAAGDGDGDVVDELEAGDFHHVLSYAGRVGCGSAKVQLVSTPGAALRAALVAARLGECRIDRGDPSLRSGFALASCAPRYFGWHNRGYG